MPPCEYVCTCTSPHENGYPTPTHPPTPAVYLDTLQCNIFATPRPPPQHAPTRPPAAGCLSSAPISLSSMSRISHTPSVAWRSVGRCVAGGCKC